MGNNKETKIVLCHTILHNSFRSDTYDEKGNLEGFKKFLRSRFITDFIITIGCEAPANNPPTFTTEKIFNEFTGKIRATKHHASLEDHLTYLRSVVHCVTNEKINEMEDTEGTVVIADALSSKGNYEPIIITDMKEGKMEFAKQYYQEHTGEAEPKIPFTILDVEEAIIFLRGRFPEMCESIRNANSQYNVI